MENEMLQSLFEVLKSTMNESKDNDKSNLYSEIQNMLLKFMQPQQPQPEAYPEFKDKEPWPPIYPGASNGFSGMDLKERKDTCCLCEAKEMVKNGGFEITNPQQNEVFKDWLQKTDGAAVRLSRIPYEGELAAKFVSNGSKELIKKEASIFQNINVTPGCLYELSFAENFYSRSPEMAYKVKLSARVFYGDPTDAAKQVDLINVVIYKPRYGTVENTGYCFHRKAAETAVPSNVFSLTIEFKFEVTDTGGTDWRIDGVSVRPIAKAIL